MMQKKWHVKLTRQEFDKKHGNDLEIGDVQTAATELEELSRSMRKFSVQTFAYIDFEID
jgi:hypothetical protein